MTAGRRSLPRQPAPIPAIPAGSGYGLRGFRKLARPRRVPQESYRRQLTCPIDNGSNSGVVLASGSVTVQVGPSGLGTRWYPTMAAISTTTGTADASTAIVYVGTLGFGSQQAAQSYTGGGDTIGLNNAELYPGLYVIAIWSGAVPGDTATLVVYGDQTVLV